MSKNIDIDFEKPKIYDEIFPKSPFYKETLKKINEKIDLIKIKKQKFDIIEPGSGTGNLTIKLIENEKINSIIAIDIDKNQCLAAREKITRKNPKIKVNCLCENAVTYIKKEKIDIIVMSFVYHEINDKNKLNFIKL